MKNLSQDQGSAPVIVEHYAAKVIRPGDTWKIFLRAEDPGGDMTDIATVLWQAGVGTYPTEVTRLMGDDRREFSGYLFLSTPNDSNLMSDELELTLLVRDSQGKRSQPIKLPLRFNLGARQEVPETWTEVTSTDWEHSCSISRLPSGTARAKDKKRPGYRLNGRHLCGGQWIRLLCSFRCHQRDKECGSCQLEFCTLPGPGASSLRLDGGSPSMRAGIPRSDRES